MITSFGVCEMLKQSLSYKTLALSALVLASLATGANAQVAKGGGSVALNAAMKGSATGAMHQSLQAPLASASQMIDVAGILSQGDFGDVGNTVLTFNVGANVRITGLSFDVNLEAYDPSWLSEIRVTLTNSAVDTGVHFRPGAGSNDPGTGSFNGSSDYEDLGIAFNVDADGILRLEFNESYNDDGLDPDGKWLSGHLTVMTAAVPEPSTYGLMALGLMGLGGIARRRQAA